MITFLINIANKLPYGSVRMCSNHSWVLKSWWLISGHSKPDIGKSKRQEQYQIVLCNEMFTVRTILNSYPTAIHSGNPHWSDELCICSYKKTQHWAAEIMQMIEDLRSITRIHIKRSPRVALVGWQKQIDNRALLSHHPTLSGKENGLCMRNESRGWSLASTCMYTRTWIHVTNANT